MLCPLTQQLVWSLMSESVVGQDRSLVNEAVPWWAARTFRLGRKTIGLENGCGGRPAPRPRSPVESSTPSPTQTNNRSNMTRPPIKAVLFDMVRQASGVTLARDSR
jgi:hypothetical protein